PVVPAVDRRSASGGKDLEGSLVGEGACGEMIALCNDARKPFRSVAVFSGWSTSRPGVRAIVSVNRGGGDRARAASSLVHERNGSTNLEPEGCPNPTHGCRPGHLVFGCHRPIPTRGRWRLGGSRRRARCCRPTEAAPRRLDPPGQRW